MFIITCIIPCNKSFFKSNGNGYIFMSLYFPSHKDLMKEKIIIILYIIILHTNGNNIVSRWLMERKKEASGFCHLLSCRKTCFLRFSKTEIFKIWQKIDLWSSQNTSNKSISPKLDVETIDFDILSMIFCLVENLEMSEENTIVNFINVDKCHDMMKIPYDNIAKLNLTWIFLYFVLFI